MVTQSLAASSRFLDPTGRFDRPAIMRAAWAMARAAVAPGRPIRGYTPPPPPSMRDAFAAGLRRAWDLARGQRACAEHRAMMVVEDARRATAPADVLAVEDLLEARTAALMIDSTRRMLAELAAIDAQAAALGIRL